MTPRQCFVMNFYEIRSFEKNAFYLLPGEPALVALLRITEKFMKVSMDLPEKSAIQLFALKEWANWRIMPRAKQFSQKKKPSGFRKFYKIKTQSGQNSFLKNLVKGLASVF